jgi:hypothetical protein
MDEITTPSQPVLNHRLVSVPEVGSWWEFRTVDTGPDNTFEIVGATDTEVCYRHTTDEEPTTRPLGEFLNLFRPIK